jgi:hypothetical protein
MSTPTQNPFRPNSQLPLLVIEDYSNLPLTRLGAILGVPVRVTSKAWMSAFAGVLPMFVATILFAPNAGLAERIALIVVWVLLFVVTSFTHSIGHIVSGQRVGAGMDELIVTNTRHVNIYHGDQSKFPARVHITRAIGGPLANILVGLVSGILWWVSGANNPTLLVVSLMNLAFGFGSLAPLPSVDGGVIVEHLSKRS